MALENNNNDITKTGTDPVLNNQENNNISNPQSMSEEKTFTQEDVNRIVQERLAREQKNNNNSDDLNAREEELNKRENRLKCAEMLNEKGIQKDLLDILDTSDVDKFAENLEKLESMGAIRSKGSKPIPYMVQPTPGPLKDEDSDLRDAFGL